MVPFQIKGLDEQVMAYCVEDSPDLLSMGKRGVDLGYAFHWEPYSQEPYLVHPDGHKIPHVVINYVPYIPHEWNGENAPRFWRDGPAGAGGLNSILKKAVPSDAEWASRAMRQDSGEERSEAQEAEESELWVRSNFVSIHNNIDHWSTLNPGI